jgi:hypothetical protein
LGQSWDDVAIADFVDGCCATRRARREHSLRAGIASRNNTSISQ